MIGPQNSFSRELHSTKHRGEGETYDDYCVRYSRATADNEAHFRVLLDASRHLRMLPAGRQQLAVGRAFQLTAMNCFVGDDIEDSMVGIMRAVTNGALTLRMGGGVGWDFSTIRPKGEPIRGLGPRCYSSGPVSFMSLWHAMSGTVMSAGHRRGAMMGMLRVDHPDILTFVNAKADQTSLTNFNISVAATDAFMAAVQNDGLYELKWGGRSFGEVRALDVWATIMERNWDYAEPGIMFVDRINAENNLWYCETLSASNPCGEQFLPPHGACLLGSLNIAQYLVPTFQSGKPRLVDGAARVEFEVDYELLRRDVEASVRAFDNVIDRTRYPLAEQQEQQKQKRRMGVGVTGMANALEVMGRAYGSAVYIQAQNTILEFIRDTAYRTSVQLAREKGSFPLFDAEKYCQGKFIKRLPEDIQHDIAKYGIRNALLTSIAPTGTISMVADNVSSGIEPVYSLEQKRLVHMPEGQREVTLKDFALENYGVRGRTTYEVTPEEHIDVLCAAQHFVDNACSKTCNINGKQHGFDAFKNLYLRAWDGGAKGCATFNVTGKRFGVLSQAGESASEGASCVVDLVTGIKSCEA